MHHFLLILRGSRPYSFCDSLTDSLHAAARCAASASIQRAAERVGFSLRSQPTFSRFSLPSASAGALLPKKAAKVFCGRNVHALVSLSSAHGGSGRGAIAASSSSSVTQAWSEACGGVYTMPG